MLNETQTVAGVEEEWNNSVSAIMNIFFKILFINAIITSEKQLSQPKIEPENRTNQSIV